MTTKVCTICGLTKPISEFKWRDKRKRRRTDCVLCHSRRNHYRKKYGITVARVAAMAEAQGHRCACCRRKTRLFVDHDHATGRVRGLLCPTCNSAIGFLEKYPKLLARWKTYLDRM